MKKKLLIKKYPFMLLAGHIMLENLSKNLNCSVGEKSKCNQKKSNLNSRNKNRKD